MIDDDEDEELKIGRFSDRDEMEARRLVGRRRRSRTFHPSLTEPTAGSKHNRLPPRAPLLSNDALVWRARRIDKNWRYSDGPQVIVKAAGRPKHRQGSTRSHQVCRAAAKSGQGCGLPRPHNNV